jgi:hypothetical protein
MATDVSARLTMGGLPGIVRRAQDPEGGRTVTPSTVPTRSPSSRVRLPLRVWLVLGLLRAGSAWRRSPRLAGGQAPLWVGAGLGWLSPNAEPGASRVGELAGG